MTGCEVNNFVTFCRSCVVKKEKKPIVQRPRKKVMAHVEDSPPSQISDTSRSDEHNEK